jgi:opacity protein-like surface antigen
MLVVVVLVVLAIAMPAQAQMSQSASQISLGVRAGANLGNFSLSPEPSGVSKSARTGLVAGAYGEIGVAPSLFITIEALYSQGGYKISAGSVEATAKIDDISVPVSLKYKFPMENASWMPFVFAGANVGFNSKAEVEVGGSSTDIKDQVESTDFGIQLGAGAEFEISPGTKLFIDGRYGLGLKDRDKSSTEAKGQNIGIMAGVSFAI